MSCIRDEMRWSIAVTWMLYRYLGIIVRYGKLFFIIIFRTNWSAKWDDLVGILFCMHLLFHVASRETNVMVGTRELLQWVFMQLMPSIGRELLQLVKEIRSRAISIKLGMADDSVWQRIDYKIKLQFKEEKLQDLKSKNGFNDFDNTVTQYLWNCIAYLAYDWWGWVWQSFCLKLYH